MVLFIWVAAFVIGYALSWAGLYHDMKVFRSNLAYHKYVTAGDTVFITLIAICLPVGWLFGLRSLIGIMADLDAPIFPQKD